MSSYTSFAYNYDSLINKKKYIQKRLGDSVEPILLAQSYRIDNVLCAGELPQPVIGGKEFHKLLRATEVELRQPRDHC